MSFVYQIDNLLTPDECQHYMDLFLDESQVELIDDKHRKYHRVQFNDAELAATLYEKVRGYLPKKIKKISVGLNNHFRLSKYNPGQFFGIHKDGINHNGAEISYATLNIFLNDNFTGGETIFYDKDKRTINFICKPLLGRGGLFYSQQYHEGAKLLSGNKYLLRTDLMINHNKNI